MNPAIPAARLNLIVAQHSRQFKDAVQLLEGASDRLQLSRLRQVADAAHQPGDLLLLGTGSSHHINRTVAPLYRQQGIQTHATPIPELFTSPLPNWGGAVFITSQSGTSNEVSDYLAHPSGQLGRHFGFTLNPECLLTQTMPTLVAPGGPELGLVATRGFLLGVLLHFLVLERLGLPLTELGRVLGAPLPLISPQQLQAVRSAPMVFFVADGLLQGVAEYAAVFLMELTRKPCFALTSEQHRQSPFAQGSDAAAIRLQSGHTAPPPADSHDLMIWPSSAAAPLMIVSQILQIQHLLLNVAQDSAGQQRPQGRT